MNYPFLTQGLGMGNMMTYSPVQPSASPGVNLSGSVGVGSTGLNGTAAVLILVVGGLVVLYTMTRGIQGSR